MPKLICVCVAFGALVTGLTLWLTEPAPRSAGMLEIEHRVFSQIMAPAIIGAIFFGLLLFLQHPRVFFRLRWLQIKLAVVAIFLPVVHAWVSSQLAALSHPELKSDGATFVAWLYIAVITLVLLIVLGRQKPRLGQNWARDFLRI
jgi:uncharacterized membrane protein